MVYQLYVYVFILLNFYVVFFSSTEYCVKIYDIYLKNHMLCCQYLKIYEYRNTVKTRTYSVKSFLADGGNHII